MDEVQNYITTIFLCGIVWKKSNFEVMSGFQVATHYITKTYLTATYSLKTYQLFWFLATIANSNNTKLPQFGAKITNLVRQNIC